MRSRFARALVRVSEWCRLHRHLSVAEQCKALGRKLRGHFEYYGITGNFEALQRFAHEVSRIWKKWLSRRSQRGWMNWEQFVRLRARHPLPPPRVAHSIYRRMAKA
jgi:hypothetical protein